MKKSLLFLAAALTFGLAANAQTAFSEDFNQLQNGAIPTGWVTYGDGLTNHYTSPATLNDSWSAYNQTMICITWTEESSPVDRWLATPQITVPSTNPMLIFDINGVNYGPGSPYAESLKIMVSTTDNQKASFSVLSDLGSLTVGNNTYAVDLSSYAGQPVYLAFACYTNDGMYIFLDNVVVKSVESNAIAAVEANAPSWAPQNGNCNVRLTVRNEGSANLTSFDITYSVNGGADQGINVTGVSVAPFTTYTHTVPVAMQDLGAATIALTVSNPNGSADPDASDNTASCATTVYDASLTVQRTTVLEHFTTGVCPNCPSAHERLEAAVQGREDNVVWIAHHVGYYTDAMTISESDQMLDFYNDGGSTYAPASMLDRDYDNANIVESNPGPIFFPGSDVSDYIANALTVPAFVSVNISDVNYNENTRELSVTVSGTFSGDMTFDSPRLSLYIMEDGIKAAQSGAQGTYTHNHVIRGCISNVWGDENVITSTTAGATFSKTFTYTLPSNWKADKCWLGAFVNNYSGNVNNRKIANGTKSGYLLGHSDPTHMGINAVEANISVKTYPNPATEMAYIEAESMIRSYSVVDALGRQVMGSENMNVNALELNVSNLAQGVYFITVTTDNGVATDRLSIVR